MAGTTIADHFDNGEEFEEVLEEAEAEARAGKEEEFVADMKKKWTDYGLRAYMSEAQASWLKRISKT